VREATRFRTKPERPVKTLDEAVAYRAAFLTDYQDSAYAARYLQLVGAVRAAENAALPGSAELTDAVAKNLFKLMAYKDEYEVARLYTDGAFAAKLRERFDGDVRLSFHLAPPLLARRDAATGHLQKREYGGWMLPAFRLLARLKFLRGTAFDPFGYTNERKAERRLIVDYEAAITRHITGLRAERISALARLARLPEMIRGYGHIKEDAIRKFTAERSRAEADIENRSFAVAAE
jgi:indolepyruvate ferredoxin oxidoreductase